MRRFIVAGIVALGLAAGVGSARADNFDRFIHRATTAKSVFEEICSWLSICPSERPLDKSYAIVIAVGDYEHLDKLTSPGRDARKMLTFLRDDQGFDEVVVLQDSDATFENVQHFMEDYFPSKLRRHSDSRFLFYFTGHGSTRFRNSPREKGYLRLAKDERGEYSRAIPMSLVEHWGENVADARHSLFIIDSCMSGLAGGERKNTYEAKRSMGDLMEERGQHLLAAGAADEDAVGGDEWGGSLFTDAFIHGIRSGKGDLIQDGAVTIEELYAYIEGVVGNETNGNQNPAIRKLGSFKDSGSMFFLYGRRPNPPPSAVNSTLPVESKGSADDAEALWARRGTAADLAKFIEIAGSRVKSGDAGLEETLRLARALNLQAEGIEDQKKAVEVLELSVDAAERALVLASPGFAIAMKNGDKLETAVKQVVAKDVPYLFWYATSLQRFAKRKGFTVMLFYKDKIKAALERCRDLNPEYYFAGPIRELGIHYGIAPAFAGGDMAKSRELLNKAIGLSPDWVDNHVALAERYAIKMEDSALFQSALQRALLVETNAVPGYKAEQDRAQNRARRLLREKDNFF